MASARSKGLSGCGGGVPLLHGSVDGSVLSQGMSADWERTGTLSLHSSDCAWSQTICHRAIWIRVSNRD